MDYLKGFLGASAPVRTARWGTLRFESVKLTDAIDGDMLVLLGKGLSVESPLVRIHSVCAFAEVFGSVACDCADQLDLALSTMKASNSGAVFYLRMEGRGVGLAAKIAATVLESSGVDTYSSRTAIGVPTDAREYSAVGEYLIAKGVRSVRLMTNNPQKIESIRSAGIKVQVQELLIAAKSQQSLELLRTKAQAFGHRIPPEFLSGDPA